MYNAFFGFHTDPFRVNPDPRFLYFSESHQEALAALKYAIETRKGFLVLTGEVGTGKTTVLNAVLSELPNDVRTACLFNTRLSVDDFFVGMLDELELEVGQGPGQPFRKSEALRVLNSFLIDRLKKGLQTLLVIDEAQNLSVELLEEVRMLSNLETPESKLIQILLIGQPELREKLDDRNLRQLRQRVELMHTIEPLSIFEVAEYVESRLRVAGHPTGHLFAASALHLVYRYSRGIPRIVNVLCDNALLSAFSGGHREVSSALVAGVGKELGLSANRLPDLEETAEDEVVVIEPPKRPGLLSRLRSR